MSKETGGQVFPIGDTVSKGHKGMTLRDYFAGQAITGLLSNEHDSDLSVQTLSRTAYKTADAMIKERGKE